MVQSVKALLNRLFTKLLDTPDSYTGHAGKTVAVTAGEDGLEFVAGGGGGGGLFIRYVSLFNEGATLQWGDLVMARMNNAQTVFMPDPNAVDALDFAVQIFHIGSSGSFTLNAGAGNGFYDNLSNKGQTLTLPVNRWIMITQRSTTTFHVFVGAGENA